MIGYYVHHQGLGHARRALAIARECSTPVTGLSSLPAPDGWPGAWVDLPRDDQGAAARSQTADGRLHWAPLHDAGLRQRMARIARWIEETAPSLIVSDVSVEVALLARLHGVPVVSVALPGERTDAPHDLGFGVSDAIIAAWPATAEHMLPGAGPEMLAKVHPVGSLSGSRRGPGRPPGPVERVLVLSGAGGGGMTAEQVDDARAATPGVAWHEIGTTAENRVADPTEQLRAASLVVTHAGQGAIADVAAAGVPAVVVPQERPHAEQFTSAATLARTPNLPVIVAQSIAELDWPATLERAAHLDGRGWVAWNDGHAAARAARILDDLADDGGTRDSR